MPPYERINAYRSPRRRPWRRWFSAALPWVFVLGVAAGTMLPVRDWLRRSLPGSVDSQAARDAEIIWKRAGNPDVRHPVDVVRTIDGDTFEARVHLAPGQDVTTRIRLRAIDAPELKAACPQELQMAEAAKGEPAYNRYKRMEAAWLALAEEQDWLDGERSPVDPIKKAQGK